MNASPKLKAALLALLASLGVALSSPPASAQEEPNPDDEAVEAAPLPPGLPKLPGPRERERLVLGSENAPVFRNVLLAPMAHWLENGALALRLLSSLDYAWTLGSEWQQASEENFRNVSLSTDGSLTLAEDASLRLGFPFGTAERINELKDPVERAQRILWNVVFAQMASGDVLYEVGLSWIGAQTVLRQSKGIFYRRLYVSPFQAPPVAAPQPPEELQLPRAASGMPTPKATIAPTPIPLTFSGSTDLLWQEVLQLFSPPVAFGYAHITWRYRGPHEDLVWLHSPVTASNRRVLQSNRSDPLLGGVLTADDLLVWSTKPQAVTAKVVDEKVLLLPFGSSTYFLAEPNEAPTTLTSVHGELSAEAVARAHRETGAPAAERSERLLTVHGYYQRPDGGSSTAVFSFETNRRSTQALWAPLSTVLVPRRVWILELTPRDPYYSTGREILVVDKESMLPFYKVVYDTAGDYAKTVIGGWTLARTKNGATRFPFTAFLLGVDKGSRSAMTIASNQVHAPLSERSKITQAVRSLLSIESHRGEPKSAPAKPDAAPPAAEEPAVDEAPAPADAGADEASPDQEAPSALPPAASEAPPAGTAPAPKLRPGTLSEPEDLDF